MAGVPKVVIEGGGRAVAPSDARRRWLAFALRFGPFPLVAMALAVIGYFWMFSDILSYDDEGYILISLRGVAAGGGLFDQVFSQYGAFFYEFFTTLFGVLHVPITLDSGRFVTLAMWLIPPFLLGIAVQRFTGRLPLALATQLLSFMALLTLVNEPMHPGGLLCLLISVVVVTGMVGLERWPRVTLATMGAVAAAACFVKVNVGVFALVSITFACIIAYRPLATRPLLRTAASLCFAALPVLLMRGLFDQPWVQVYSVHVAIAAASLAVVTSGLSGDPRRAPSELPWSVAGAVGSSIAIAGAALAHGTSPLSLVRGTLLDRLRQADVLALPLHLPPKTLIVDCVILGLAIIWTARRMLGREPNLQLQGAARITGGLLIWIGLLSNVQVPGVMNVAVPGNGAAAPLGLPLALAWIIAVPRADADGYRDLDFPRVLLAAMAVLQSLQAFPVAGSQVGWSVLLLVPVGAVAIADGLAQLRWPSLRTSVGAGLLLVVLVATVRPSVELMRASYLHNVRLQLAGAERVRTSPDRVAVYRKLTATLTAHCSTFISLPGLNSLYIMSGERPPTQLNTTAWMYLLDDSQQQRIVDSARTIPRLCVVRNDAIVDYWRQGRPLPEGPLLTYIDRNFVPLQRDGDYEVLVRPTR